MSESNHVIYSGAADSEFTITAKSRPKAAGVYADASWDSALNGYTVMADGNEVGLISYGNNAFNTVSAAVAAVQSGDSLYVFGLNGFNTADYDLSGVTGTIYLSNGSFTDSGAKQAGDFRWDGGQFTRDEPGGSATVGEGLNIYALSNFKDVVVSGGAVVANAWGGSFSRDENTALPQVYTEVASGSLTVTSATVLEACGYETVTLNAGAQWKQVVGGWCGSPDPMDWKVSSPFGSVTVNGVENTISGNTMIGYLTYDVANSTIGGVKAHGVADKISTLTVSGISSLDSVDLSYGSFAVADGAAVTVKSLTVSGGVDFNYISGSFTWAEGSSFTVAAGAAVQISSEDFAQLAGAGTIDVEGALVVHGDLSWSVLSELVAASSELNEIIVVGKLTGVDGGINLATGKGNLAGLAVARTIYDSQGAEGVQVSVGSGTWFGVNLKYNRLDAFNFTKIDGTLELFGNITWADAQAVAAEAGRIGKLVVDGGLSALPTEIEIGGDKNIGSLVAYQKISAADFITRVELSSGGFIMLPEITCNLAVDSEDGTGSALIAPSFNESGYNGMMVASGQNVVLNVPLLAAAEIMYGAESYWVSSVVVEKGGALWIASGIDMSNGMQNFISVDGYISFSGIVRSIQQITVEGQGRVEFTSTATGGGANLNCLAASGSNVEVVIASSAQISFAKIEVSRENDNAGAVISGSFSALLGLVTSPDGDGSVSVAFDGSNLANFGGDEPFIVTFDGLVTLNGSATALSEVTRVMELAEGNYISQLEIAGDFTGVDALAVGGGQYFTSAVMVDGNLAGGGSGTLTTLSGGKILVAGAVNGVREVKTTAVLGSGANAFQFGSFEGVEGGSTLLIGTGCSGIVGTLSGTVAITVNGGCYLNGVASGATVVTGLVSNHGGFSVASGAAFSTDFFSGSDLVTVAGIFALTGNSRSGRSTLYDILLSSGGTLDIGVRSEAYTNSIQVSGGRGVISGFIAWADDDSATLNVESGSELVIGGDQLGELLDAATIKVAGTLTVDADLDWSTVRTVKSGYDIAELKIDGAIYNADKMLFDTGARFEVTAEAITGTSKADSIVAGAGSLVALNSDIDLRAGNNTLTVKSNAAFSAGAIANTGKVSIDSGKVYKNSENAKVQGFTSVKLGGSWSGSGNTSFTVGNFCNVGLSGELGGNAGNVTVKIGQNSMLSAGGDIYATSLSISDSSLYTSEGETLMGTSALEVDGVLFNAAGKSSVKVGKLAQLLVAGIAFGDDRNALNLTAGARVVIYGDATGLNSISLASSTTYKDESGEKQTAYCRFRVSGNFTGTSYNDNIKVGADAAAHIAGWLDLLGGNNSFSIGSNAEFLVGGSVSGVTGFTLASGRTYLNSEGVKEQGTTQAWVQDYYASQGNAMVNMGGFSYLKVSGYFGRSLNGGALKVGVGGQSKLLVGGEAAGISRLSLSGGKYVKSVTDGELSGYTIAEFTGKFTGTSGNDAVSAGNYCSAVFGNIDLGEGKNTVSFGNNGILRLNGTLENIYSATFGKNCTIQASTEAVAALYALGKNFKVGSGTVVIDIGAAGIAANFTTVHREVVVDAALDSTAVLSDGAAGWLSSKQAYSGVQTVEDTVDYFKTAYGDDLSGWYVTGDAGILEVKVWQFDGENWDGGTLVQDQDGSWNLGSVDISSAADYRVSVALASESEKNVYAYTLSTLPV